MALDSRRRNRGFPDSIGQPCLGARAGLRLTLLASCLVSAAAVAQAQETVVIGGGSAPSGGFAAPAPIGEPGSGIQVNDSVLDSLGAGPAGAVPMAAPQTPVYGTGMASPDISTSPAPSGAYRLPGSGELVVTRPSTLLYPPMEAPQSRLALTPPERAVSQPSAQNAQRGSNPAPAMTDGKLKSRLIAEPPKQPMTAPAQAAEAPAAPKPVAQPKAAPAPAMPSLTEQTRSATSTTQSASTSSRQQPPVATSIAPAPREEAPKAPSVPAPSVAAPSVPAVPAPVATPAPPSAPPSSLTAAQPAPSPSTAPEPAKPAQSAALTEGTSSSATPAPVGELRLGFAEGSAELSDEAKQSLLDLAKSLAQDTTSRVQLLAFAADGGEGTSRARRLSLSRALAVRAFLIDQGVRSTRMDVRALGSNAGDGPADRVDILAR